MDVGINDLEPGRRAATKSCAVCGIQANLQTCIRCRKVYYCSREHQKAHWKSVHKRECRKPGEA